LKLPMVSVIRPKPFVEFAESLPEACENGLTIEIGRTTAKRQDAAWQIYNTSEPGKLQHAPSIVNYVTAKI
jgi:hypothetical protein